MRIAFIKHSGGTGVDDVFVVHDWDGVPRMGDFVTLPNPDGAGEWVGQKPVMAVYWFNDWLAVGSYAPVVCEIDDQWTAGNPPLSPYGGS